MSKSKKITDLRVKCRQCDHEFTIAQAIFEHDAPLWLGCPKCCQAPGGATREIETGDLSDGEILIVGKYTITRSYGGNYWISTDRGEGMQPSEKKMIKLIDEFYKARF